MNTNIKDTGETRITHRVTQWVTRIKANYTNKLFVPFVPIRVIRVIFFVFFVPLWFLVFACDTKQPPQTKGGIQTAINNRAPDLALLDMNNKEVKLADLIGTKPLVLDFWASWCPTCRAEIPKVVELHNQYQDKITIVGINLDKTFADAQAYTKKHNIPYPNLYDEGNKVTGLYEIHGIPSLVIIDSQGQIIKRDATLADVKALIAKEGKK